jgi:hypothetical protein
MLIVSETFPTNVALGQDVQDISRPAPSVYYFWTPKHRMPLSQGQVAALKTAAGKSSRGLADICAGA